MEYADSILQMGQSSEWLSVLLTLSVKSFIILAAAALLTHILRDASAKLRHLLWCGTLFGLLLLPLFSARLQPLHVPILPSTEFAQQSSPDASPELRIQTSLNGESQSKESDFPMVNSPAQPSFSWQSIILLVWLTGALLVLARFVVGIVIVRRLVARASELKNPPWTELSSELSKRLGLKRTVRLVRSEERLMPVACGGLSAVVLLPDEAEGWSDERRRVVLLHELIHVKRRDLLTQTIAQLVCAVYWFNPLVWWAVRKLRTEQEWACDESVVQTGIEASDYAEHLLEIARRFHANTISTVATMSMARSSQFQERLYAILRPTCEEYRSGGAIAGSAVTLGVVFTLAAVTQLVPAERQIATYVSDVSINPKPIEQEQREMPLSVSNARVVRASVAPASEVDHLPHPNASPTPIEQRASDQPLDSHDALAIQIQEPNFNDFSSEEQARLRSNGIGQAYINEMASVGYRDLTVEELIALFTNSVHADYVEGLRSVGYGSVSIRDLLSLKTNGITPEVIRSYQAVKHAPFEAKRYVALVSNGVTPSYFKSLADAGYESLSANKGIELHLAGITANFIYEVRGRGFVNLSPNDLIELKRREKD